MAGHPYRSPSPAAYEFEDSLSWGLGLVLGWSDGWDGWDVVGRRGEAVVDGEGVGAVAVQAAAVAVDLAYNGGFR